MSQKVLLLDDDAGMVRVLQLGLEKHGYEVCAALSSREAVEACNDEFKPDILLTDWLLKESDDGLTVARRVLKHSPEAAVVVMTGLPSEEVLRRASDVRIDAVVQKPARIADVVRVLEECSDARPQPTDRSI